MVISAIRINSLRDAGWGREVSEGLDGWETIEAVPALGVVLTLPTSDNIGSTMGHNKFYFI